MTACQGTKGEETTTQDFSNDQVGNEPVDGVIRIAAIDRDRLNVDGSVTYRIDNVSDEDLESLSATVVFYYPPSGDSEIALSFETDVTEERSVVLFKGQSGFEISATSRVFAERKAKNQKLLATRLDVTREELVAAVERDAETPGTRLFNGRLECVAISPEDDRVRFDNPTLWVDLENISPRNVSNLEVKVVLLETVSRRRARESGWHKVKTLGPGQVGRATIDLSKLGRIFGEDILLKVRQSAGLF